MVHYKEPPSQSQDQNACCLLCVWVNVAAASKASDTSAFDLRKRQQGRLKLTGQSVSHVHSGIGMQHAPKRDRDENKTIRVSVHRLNSANVIVS